MNNMSSEITSIIGKKYPTEAACARAIGWDRRALNKLTTGKKEPNLTELLTLSNALECSAENLAIIFLRVKSPNGQRKS